MEKKFNIVTPQSLVKESITSVTEKGFRNIEAMHRFNKWDSITHKLKVCFVLMLMIFVVNNSTRAQLKGGVDSLGNGAGGSIKGANNTGEKICDFWLKWTGAVKAKSVNVNGKDIPLTNKVNGKQHVIFDPCVDPGKPFVMKYELTGNATNIILILTDSIHSDLLVNTDVNPNAADPNKLIEKTTLPGGTQSPKFAPSQFPSLGYKNLTGTDICDLRIESAQPIDSVRINNAPVDVTKVNGVTVPKGASANSKVVHVYFKCIKDGEEFKVSVATKAEITTYNITPTDSIGADIMSNTKVQDNGVIPNGSRANGTNTSGGKQSPTFAPSSMPRLPYKNATGTAICDMRIEAASGALIQEVWVNDKPVDSIYGPDGKKVTTRPANKGSVHVFFPCISDGDGYSMTVKFNKACTTYVYLPTDSMRADLCCGIQNIHPGDKATRTVKFSGATPGSTFSTNKSSTVFVNDTKEDICDLEIIVAKDKKIAKVEVNGVKWNPSPAGANDTMHVNAPNGGCIPPGGKFVVTITCAAGDKIDGYTIRFTNPDHKTIYQVACTGGNMDFNLPNDGYNFGTIGRSGSLVAINESCSPISQLVFTSPHPGISVTNASSTLPSTWNLATHTLNFSPPVASGAVIQFDFMVNALRPYDSLDVFPYTTVNVSASGGTDYYDGTAEVTKASSPAAYDGSLDFTLTGNVASTGYLWSNGSTTQDLTNIATGTYTVTVNLVSGCMHKTFDVGYNIPPQPVAPKFELTGYSPWCAGSGDGQVILMDNIKAGEPSPVYNWSNGNTTAVNSGLGAGTYTVNATYGGFTWSGTISLIEPTPVNVAGTVTRLKCNKDLSGSINITPSGGTAPYLFKWNNGKTTEDRAALAAGTYTVMVTDANGCSTTSSFKVTQPAPLVANATGSFVPCAGATGTASVTATGGTKPYAYAWSPAIGLNSTSTATVTGVHVGIIYTVLVTDIKGCSASGTAMATSNPPIIIFIQPVFPSSAIANVTGGMPPYTFFWNTIPPQTGPMATGLLPNQTVELTVTDFAGCSQTQTFVMPHLRVGDIFSPGEAIGLTVFPNPAKDIVILHISGDVNETSQIKIFDALGKLVINETVLINNGTDVALNVGNLEDGIYSLEVMLQGQPQRLKLSVHN